MRKKYVKWNVVDMVYHNGSFTAYVRPDINEDLEYQIEADCYPEAEDGIIMERIDMVHVELRDGQWVESQNDNLIEQLETYLNENFDDMIQDYHADYWTARAESYYDSMQDR
jgi:hypothetical protein